MIRLKPLVTEKAPASVTKKRVGLSLVTKIREMAKRQVGRPRNPNKLTASQKQKAYRERKKARG